MTKIAFSIGPLNFSWFGLIVTAAILLVCAISWWQIRQRGENPDRLIDLMLYGVPVGIISARIYYVAVNWQLYAANPEEIPRIWHGGLAIHGAFLGIILVMMLYTHSHCLSFWRWADIVAPGLIVGQAVGQWGNFINQDAFGYPTDAPWGIYIDYAYRPAGYEQFDFFHPTFLYEFGWDVLVFIMIASLSWQIIKSRNVAVVPGSVFLLYVFLYSAGRFVIEGLRLDSEMLGSWRLAQVVSGIVIIGSGALLAWRNTKP